MEADDTINTIPEEVNTSENEEDFNFNWSISFRRSFNLRWLQAYGS